MEKWPFHDESSGAKIFPGQYYGFSDSGGLAGSFEGYPTRMTAFKAIAEDHDCSVGFLPQDLGEKAIAILSGLEYVDRLRFICSESANDMLPENLDKIDISIYGHWSQ